MKKAEQEGLSEEVSGEKLRYEKPAIVYREKIEARAGVCGGGSPPKNNTAACGPPLTS